MRLQHRGHNHGTSVYVAEIAHDALRNPSPDHDVWFLDQPKTCVLGQGHGQQAMSRPPGLRRCHHVREKLWDVGRRSGGLGHAGLDSRPAILRNAGSTLQ